MISKNLITTGIITILAAIEGIRKDNMCLIFTSIFFVLIMIELKSIRRMIKNIGPWY